MGRAAAARRPLAGNAGRELAVGACDGQESALMAREQVYVPCPAVIRLLLYTPLDGAGPCSLNRVKLKASSG